MLVKKTTRGKGMTVMAKAPFGFFPLLCCIHKKEQNQETFWLQVFGYKVFNPSERCGLVQVES